MPFKPVDDFAPVAILAYVTNVLVAHPSVKANTVAELIAFVRANPGKINYASAGSGSTNHLSAALFEKMAGISMTHVPYKGGAPALTDVVGGQIPVGILIYSNIRQHVAAGRLRALAVIESTRAKAAPDVPTVAEAGVPGFAVPDTWIGIMGPAGLPREVLARLNSEILKAAGVPAVRTRLEVYHSQTRPLVDYYSGWADTGDALAPQYRKISGLGTVEEITARALQALG
jgi:tripartite-type tricarboxylate transporter receptor subunit TctC